MCVLITFEYANKIRKFFFAFYKNYFFENIVFLLIYIMIEINVKSY